MAKKLKKANIHKKSNRAIEQAERIQEEEERTEQKKAKYKKDRKDVMDRSIDNMFALWSIGSSVIAWLVDYMGIFAIIGTVLGVLGVRRFSKQKGKYFYLSLAGIVLGLIRLATEYIPFIMSLMK
jgi:nucleoside permease NupC